MQQMEAKLSMGRCFFPRGGHRTSASNKQAAEALEKLHHGGRVVSREEVNGAVRVKIVVSKRELKQMVAALGSGAGAEHHHRPRGAAAAAGAASAEQRLHALRRRRMKKAEAERLQMQQQRGEWEPCLQSIPEEIY